jgi:quinol monooxygenase YgiN
MGDGVLHCAQVSTSSRLRRWFAYENKLKGEGLTCQKWIVVHSFGLLLWVEWPLPFSLLHLSRQAGQGGYFVIAEIVSKKEKADELRALLVPFAEKSAKEPGCLVYTLMEVTGEPGRFLTFERWTDKAALDAHMVTPDIKAIVPKLEPVLAKPFTQIFLAAVSGA